MLNELEQYRDKIDKLDIKIFDLLAERFAIVKSVGEYKRVNNLQIKDKQRESELITEKIKNSQLDAAFVRDFYKLIFNASYKLEK